MHNNSYIGSADYHHPLAPHFHHNQSMELCMKDTNLSNFPPKHPRAFRQSLSQAKAPEITNGNNKRGKARYGKLGTRHQSISEEINQGKLYANNITFYRKIT